MLRLGSLALLLCSTLLAAPTAHAAADPQRTDPRHTAHRAARAEAALDKVTSLLDDGLDSTLGTDSGELTLALRDLALLRSALPPAQQREASTYLSRPTANPNRCPDASCYTTKSVRRMCSKTVCVHYVTKADDAVNGVPRRNRDGDHRPDYVEKVLATMTRVHQRYVDAGYRRPMSDGTRGGDGRSDIYLAQIGNQGLYGYCTTDASSLPRHGATWAYCVLDNDYSHREFPRHTSTQNMQVTAAHEYFHAVQFGYDIGADAWFMEATATWAEDEVFDAVNDNTGYLPYGPMGKPGLPLDTFRGGYWYGAWIFFRHLTEHFPQAQAGLPILVRTMWRNADAATATAPALYATAAIEAALADKGTDLRTQLLRMAADNLHPRRWYDEGRLYPATRLNGSTTLSPTQPRKALGFAEDHLTSASYRFEPSHTGPRWHLSLSLDLAPVERGSAALVRVLLETGGVRTTVVELTDAGDYTGSFDFGAGAVKAVEVTVVNGSARYNCEVGTKWTCNGRPLDQDQHQSVVAEAQRV
ncbi:MXAN_6640 family putative metalloprotease [Nocardioides sp. MH1]|uniref:MXAN_6640 family putative metalloprotease n=1 Tax=Nocardioides sp. MH1 TaxID=3242490 RepID=UPI003521B590